MHFIHFLQFLALQIDFTTCSALRSKFNQDRRIVFPPESLRDQAEEELKREQKKTLMEYIKILTEKPPPSDENPPTSLADDYAP
jgi:hypothetical protein